MICCRSTTLGDKDRKDNSGCSSHSSASAHDGNNGRTKVDQIMRSLVKKIPCPKAHANNVLEVNLGILTFPCKRCPLEFLSFYRSPVQKVIITMYIYTSTTE